MFLYFYDVVYFTLNKNFLRKINFRYFLLGKQVKITNYTLTRHTAQVKNKQNMSIISLFLLSVNLKINSSNKLKTEFVSQSRIEL